jgi:hypothetical protein
LRTIWYNTQPNSKFRLFLTRCWTYTFVHCENYAGWPTADYCEGVGGVQLESLHILRLLLKPDSLIGPIQDPRYAPACDYHQHDKNYPCPQAHQVISKQKQEVGEEEDHWAWVFLWILVRIQEFVLGSAIFLPGLEQILLVSHKLLEMITLIRQDFKSGWISIGCLVALQTP